MGKVDYRINNNIGVSPVVLNVVASNNLKQTWQVKMFCPILNILLFFGLETYHIHEDRRTKILGYLCIRMFYVASAAFAMTGILLVDEILKGISLYSLSTTVILVIGFVFRWALQLKGKAIFGLLCAICDFKGVTPKKLVTTRRRLLIISVLVVVFEGLVLVFLLQKMVESLINSEMNAFDVSKRYSVIFKNAHLGILARLWILSIALIYVHNVIPFCLFGILYAAISWRLRAILKSFKNRLLKSSGPKISECSETYNRICSLVNYTDKTLNSLMFISVFFMSCILYFTVFNMLLPSGDGYVVTPNRIISLLNLIFMVIYLYGMLYFASEIPNVVADISDVIHSMVVDKESVGQKVELLLRVHQGLFLSVGQMVIIRKGLFLVLIGTIATYCLLINSFPLKPAN
ncbi:hypothetical protein JTE90_008495 [Oedothorax gibbosus]|uniref:Gustatory receptor n=1 Tax=Oedothorax gibbosus TaxID=931172 RepID=A0AAV6UYS1_9ARAC|nr:hypothetical protein JTE90_008495 [Oedothorax gibbosus]